MSNEQNADTHNLVEVTLDSNKTINDNYDVPQKIVFQELESLPQLEFDWIVETEPALLLVAQHVEEILAPARERMSQYRPDKGWYYHTQKHVDVVASIGKEIVQAMLEDTDRYPEFAQMSQVTRKAFATVIEIIARYHDLFLEEVNQSEKLSAEYMQQQIIKILASVEHSVEAKKIALLIEKMMEAICSTKVDFGVFAETRQLIQFHEAPTTAKSNPLAVILCQSDLAYFGGEFSNYLFFSAGIAREIEKLNPESASMLNIHAFLQDQVAVLTSYKFFDLGQQLMTKYEQQRSSNAHTLQSIVVELEKQILEETGKELIADVTVENLPSIQDESPELSRFRKIFNLQELDSQFIV